MCFAPALLPTTQRGSAAEQARQAIAAGAQAVFACGGDGTVHDVLQGVAGTNVLFGVLPLGSANALARELCVPQDVVCAAAQYRPESWMDVPLSLVRRAGMADRLFLSIAGAGPDGALMYRMLTADRGRWGHWMYYAHALRLFLAHDFPAFAVRTRRGLREQWVERQCVSVMALRVGRLGGMFAGMARGASLHGGTMRIVLVHAPARVNLPLWFVASWLGVSRWHPGLTIVDGDRVWIQAGPHLQADGEWLGAGEATLCLVGQTVRVLRPTLS